MYARLVRELDRKVISVAAQSLEREIASERRERPNESLEHPEYFETLPGAEIDFELDRGGAFRFPSPVQSGSQENDTVRGRLFEAKRRRPTANGSISAPLVVLLHGWNGEKGYDYLFPLLARRFAGQGVATAMITLPYHGLRKPRDGPYHNFLSGNVEHMMLATRQAIADIRALIQWASREGYDSIGLWGFSLGAWIGGLVSSAEPALRAQVLMTPVPRIDLAIEQLAFCRHIRESLAGLSITPERLNLSSNPPLLPPDRTLLVAAKHDLFAPLETIEALREDWGEPEIWRVNHGHISVLLSLRVNNGVVHWLADRLVDKTGEVGIG